MMHPLRRLMMIAEGRLNELTDTSAGGLPPLALDDEKGRRKPEGGKYWFRGEKKIALSAGGRAAWQMDFATEPLFHYKTFGFDAQAMLHWLDAYSSHAAESFRRFLSATDPHSGVDAPKDYYQDILRKEPGSAFGSLGTRSAGIGYAVSQGWAFIEYDEQHSSLWMAEEHAAAVVESAGDLFPMIGMETIRVVIPGDKNTFTRKSIQFHREDHSSFTGAFGALARWAGRGEVPEQSWLYTIIPDSDGALVQADGIHGKPGQFVQTGNWTDRNVHALPYHHREIAPIMARRASGTIYRFPASVAGTLGLRSGGDSSPTLFSKADFVVPASVIQRKTVGGWKPYAG